MKKIRGGQIFGFTTVKPETSKWPGRVLVIDRKILKPFLEPSHKTKTMVRSPHWYHKVEKVKGTLTYSASNLVVLWLVKCSHGLLDSQ